MGHLGTMRTEYHHRLAQLEADVLSGIDLAVEAVEVVLDAIALDDETIAFSILSGDRIEGRCALLHEEILELVALQAPVATDLRVMMALIDVVARIERIGRQCSAIAALAGSEEEPVTPDPTVLESIATMGQLVIEQLLMAKRAFSARDVAGAEALVRHDQEINRLNRDVFRRGLEVGGAPAIREWAMRMALTARCLERIGDNAVDVGERAAFIVTGQLREFSDASRPGGRPREA